MSSTLVLVLVIMIGLRVITEGISLVLRIKLFGLEVKAQQLMDGLPLRKDNYPAGGYKIIIDDKEHRVHTTTISRVDLLKRGWSPHVDLSANFIITYGRGPKGQEEGFILKDGPAVSITNGMTFNIILRRKV